MTNIAPASLSNPVISGILLMLAGVTLYLAVQSLVVWLSRRSDRVFLTFAGWSLASSIYLFAQQYQYRAPTWHAAVLSSRVTVGVCFLIAAFLLACMSEMTGRPLRRSWQIAMWAVAITLTVCTLAFPGTVLLDGGKLLQAPFHHAWVSPRTGPLFDLFGPLIALVLVKLYGDLWITRDERERTDTWMLCGALTVYAMAGLNDMLVTLQVFHGMMVFEYAAVFMVALVDSVLVRTKKRLHDEVASAWSAVEHHRRTDELTGLPNRVEFERVAALLRGSSLAEVAATSLGTDDPFAGVVATKAGEIAVVCLDIARFKTVNDASGHAFGDAILAQVAERLRGATEGTECRLVARPGGDEFMLLVVPDESQPGRGAAVAARNVIDVVFNAFETPVAVGGESRVLAFRAGLAAGDVDGEGDVRDLMNNAEAALDHARRKGWHAIEEFSADAIADTVRVSTIETGMRQALTDGQFSLVYQPKVRIRSGEVYGCEALLRWHHPTLGFVSPADFIPIAEESGFIVTLGTWVLREGFRQAASWAQIAAAIGTQPLSVSVNVSPAQLVSPGFFEQIVQLLDETGVPPELLEIEITETALMQNRDLVSALLSRMRELGLRVSLDDFGTGYSSLSYLADLTFDVVKLDRAFIKNLPGDPDAEFITHMVMALGEHKGVSVVAEGIETEEQRAFLVDVGCDSGQGWLFGKPMAVADFTETVLLKTLA